MGNDISRAFSLLKTLLSLSQSSYNTKLPVTNSADKHPNSLSHCVSLSVMPVYHIALRSLIDLSGGPCPGTVKFREVPLTALLRTLPTQLA